MFLLTAWCIIFIWTLEGATGLTLVFSLRAKNLGEVESQIEIYCLQESSP